MAAGGEWSKGYARQADADLRTFEALQSSPLPECHKLQFLQMACEKLVKAHLCGKGTDPASLQKSHNYVAGTLRWRWETSRAVGRFILPASS